MSAVQSFGQFLLTKAHSPGSLGELAKAAKLDPKFPRQGSPRDVSLLLNRHQAPPEFHEALEEAVLEWQSAQ